MVLVIGALRIRRTAAALVALVAAMLGVVASTAAGVRELRGSPYRIGSGFLVFSPNGRLLVTLDTFAGPDPRPVWVMSVNTVTGALHTVRGAPFALGSIPMSAAFSPDGHLLAVNTFSGQIVVFSVNRRTGTLHQASHWSDPHGRADQVAFSPRGGLLAAQDEGKPDRPRWRELVDRKPEDRAVAVRVEVGCPEGHDASKRRLGRTRRHVVQRAGKPACVDD